MPESGLGQRQLHVPVMVQEVLSLLVHDPNGTYVDCTLGCGGHAAAILGKLSHQGRLIGLDKDRDSVLVANEKLKAFGDRVFLFDRDSRDLPEILNGLGIESISGVLLDLGISSHQLDSERGFSFARTSALDMRFDSRSGVTAAEFLNTCGEEELTETLRLYGDVTSARRLARAVVEFRKRRPLATSLDLVSAVKSAVLSSNPNRCLARVFQSVRIRVNDEIGALREGLVRASGSLGLEGRLCVISYHSGEDRIVKQFMKSDVSFGDGRVERLELLTQGVLRPTQEEIFHNTRARSARLRAARRTGHEQIP
ncbi:MAG: 16S rRNA (cytosine(1402)-N(4))-methyltransferase RsmH [Candidatus Eisenbacteria bacterium]